MRLDDSASPDSRGSGRTVRLIVSAADQLADVVLLAAGYKAQAGAGG